MGCHSAWERGIIPLSQGESERLPSEQHDALAVPAVERLARLALCPPLDDDALPSAVWSGCCFPDGELRARLPGKRLPGAADATEYPQPAQVAAPCCPDGS